MRPVVITVIGVALVAAITGVLIWAKPTFSFVPYVNVCQHDDDIAQADRSAMEGAARQYVQTLLGPRPGDAFDLMSAYGQTNATREQLANLGRMLSAEAPDAAPIDVRRTFLIKGAAPSRQGVMIACGGAPGAIDYVRQNDAAEQGHVLLSYPLPSGGAKSAALWLTYERARWRTTYFFVTSSQVLNHNARDLFEQAQTENAQGHKFNAFFLYRVAANLAQTGSHMQLGENQRILNAQPAYPRLPGVEGDAAPYRWTIDGQTFEYNQWLYFALSKEHQVMLEIKRTAPYRDDADAEAQNRAFIDAINSAYPEWTNAFYAIGVQTAQPGSHDNWGTVFIKGLGYAAPPTESAHAAATTPEQPSAE